MSSPSHAERFTKLFVLVMLAAAACADTWAASRPWLDLRLVVPAVFVAVWIWSRVRPAMATRAVVASCFLVPGAFLVLTGDFFVAEWIVWLSALLGVIGSIAPVDRWSIPRPWRLPLVFWALIVAATWPLVVFREADFHWSLIGPTMLAWVVTTAMIMMAGVLWFDALCARYLAAPDGPVRFEREVLSSMIAGWSIAGAVAVYQMLGHIRFLNDSFWAELRRATGTFGEANVLGVISAMCGPVVFTLLWERPWRWQKAVGVAALGMSWAVVWGSGSRSSLLIVALSVLAISAALWRRYGVRRTIAVFALAMPVLAVLVLGLIAVTGGAVMGPGARFVRDFAPQWSLSWAEGMAGSLWTRGAYGPVASLMIREWPVTGVGIGAFHFVWSSFAWRAFHAIVPADNAQSWYRHGLAELGIVGSLGWIAWSLSLLWFVARARSRAGRWLGASMARAVIVGFGLISLVGVPAQELPVVVAFWTVVFWFVASVESDHAQSQAEHPRLRSWVWLGAIVLVVMHLSATAYLAGTALRPPVRAYKAGMAYDYGFYEPEGTMDGAPFRWAEKNAVVVLPTGYNYMKFSVWVNHADIERQPVDVQVRVDERLVLKTRLRSTAPVTRYVAVARDGSALLETWVSRAIRPVDLGVPDARELGLLVSWKFMNVLPADATLVQ